MYYCHREQCINIGKCKWKGQCNTVWLCGVFFRRLRPKSVCVIQRLIRPRLSLVSSCGATHTTTLTCHWGPNLCSLQQACGIIWELEAASPSEPAAGKHKADTERDFNEMFCLFAAFSLLPHLLVSPVRYLTIVAGHWKDFELHYFHLWPSAQILLWMHWGILGW